MTEIVNDATLSMYVEESKEHLEDIETDLLEIEQQGKEVDEELVNRVFRAAHSIKGGAGFLNLIHIKELSHKIENVLDMVRHGQLVPGSEVVSTVLEAFDFLGTMLDDVLESNGMDIADHVGRLEAIVSANLADSDKDSLHTFCTITHPKVKHSFEVLEFDVKQAGQNGKNFYIIEFDLLKDAHRKNITPLEILSKLEDGGIIVDITIGLEAVGSLEDEQIGASIPMFVFYASIIEPDLLPVVLDLTEDKIHVVHVGQLQGADEAGKDIQKEEAEPAEEILESAPKAGNAPPLSPEPEQPGPAPKVLPKEKEGTGARELGSGLQTESLRVNVSILDQLMNRAGELVLARNQLMQALSTRDQQGTVVAGQRLDMVTSELQETIMLTRMQPVGNIFNKFPRVVRDLAKQLGKEIELTLEGKDVELDKTIIEGLGDPLTHLVRNAADHGIELPEARLTKGKSTTGHIFLRASHESGQVVIEIQDDGKGVDPEKIAKAAVDKGMIGSEQVQDMSDSEKINLIMLPGFSSVDQVTEVSGRGVGMDVVKTNLDKLGGQVEIISVVDKGSRIRVKLPLTLAIIPSLLVMSRKERFAIPQVNVCELLRIPASEVRTRIEKIGEAEILSLRGELIPLLQLSTILQLKNLFFDPRTGTYKEDRRARLADERLLDNPDTEMSDDLPAEAEKTESVEEIEERRNSRRSDVNIAIVQAGSMRYGLVVDELRDNIEIVVKPLGRHLKNCEVYAGATIMGDGHLALILDVAGLSSLAELKAVSETDAAAQQVAKKKTVQEGVSKQTMLIFRNGPEEFCAVPLSMVLRVEKIQAADIEIRGGKKVIQYRGGHLSIYALEEVADVEVLEERKELIVLVFSVAGKEVGLLAVPPLDAVEIETVIDEATLRQPGIQGSAIIQGQTTLIVDIVDFMQTINPDWFAGEADEPLPEQGVLSEQHSSESAILLVEDSDFFREQVLQFLAADGLSVVSAEDGQVAWDYLEAHPGEIALVVTDIEMPVMDGFELTRRIKSDARFAELPVIALTSLASEEDMAKGREVGIDEYQIKMDKDNLLQSIHAFLTG